MDPQSSDSASTLNLVPELAHEARSLFERGSSSLWISVGTAVLLLWALRAILRGMGRVSAHFGVDRGRRFARLSRGIQLIVLLLVIGELLQSAAQVAPVWVS